MYVYSLFDRKLKLFGQLVLERNDFAVQRSLVDGLAGAPDSLMAKHPEDFDLYHVGMFDDEAGKLTGEDFKLVCCVRDLVASVHLTRKGQDEFQKAEAGRRKGPLGKEGVSG